MDPVLVAALVSFALLVVAWLALPQGVAPEPKELPVSQPTTQAAA